jgi:hypothetical protein
VGIGHVAVGLGLKAADRRLNAGLLIFAALFSDFVLGWFVWAGWENYQYPDDYATSHYMVFLFPWSHGLISCLVFATCLGMLAWAFRSAVRAGVLVGIAVLSHFLLDGLVHVNGLPVLGPRSWKFGLGLWQNLPLELTLEALMTVAALALYWRAARDHTRGRRIAMVVYVVLLAAFLIGGQLSATAPTPQNALIASWIAMPVLSAVIAWVIDRQKTTASESSTSAAA